MVDDSARARLDFLRVVEKHVRALPGVLGTERIADDFALHISVPDREQPTVFYLQHLWNEIQGFDSQARSARITHYVTALLGDRPEVPSDREELLERLRPVLRGLHAVNSVPGQKLLWRPALEHLAEILVVDAPQTMSFVQQSSLAAARITPELAFARARENLRQRTPKVELAGELAQKGMLLLKFGDDYESSRLLLPEWLAHCAAQVESPLLMAAPERDTLVLCIENDRESINGFAKRVQEHFEKASRGISPAIYTLSPTGNVNPYRPGNDHPARAALELGHKKLELATHQNQSEALATEMPPELAGARVLAFRVSQPSGNRPAFSWCEWSGSHPMLMPMTDYVVVPGRSRWLRRPEKWWLRGAEFRSWLGAACQPVPALHPPLLLVTRGPQARDAGWLRQCAIPEND